MSAAPTPSPSSPPSRGGLRFGQISELTVIVPLKAGTDGAPRLRAMRTMDRAEAQRETLQMLAAEKVDAAQVIKDAISRDQALDAFADFTHKKIQALKEQVEAEEKKWNEWRGLKRQREQEMARAVGLLIDKPVISIDEE